MLDDFYFGPCDSEGDSAALGSDDPGPPERAAGDEAPGPGKAVTLSEITELGNASAAWQRVARNKGAPGVDHVAVDDIADGFSVIWQRTADSLHRGTWRPSPLRRVVLPKADGGRRLLGIPTVMDRVVAQACALRLSTRWEPRFSQHSHAYRPRRSPLDAVTAIRNGIDGGLAHCLHLDIADCFGSIPHAPLLARLASTPCSTEVSAVVARLLEAPILEEGRLMPSTKGVAQGSPLSPLLANIALDPLDRWLAAQGLPFARYADDTMVLLRSRHEAEKMIHAIAERLAAMGLTLHPHKTTLTQPEVAAFLGFTFRRSTSTATRLAVSTAALEACEAHLKGLPPGPEVTRFLKAWRSYYRHSDDPGDWQRILAFAKTHCGIPKDSDPCGTDEPVGRRSGVGYAGTPPPPRSGPPPPSRPAWFMRLIHRVASLPVRLHIETTRSRRVPWIPRLTGFRVRFAGHSFRFRF